MKKYVLGTDFGTLSARTVLVDISDGRELAETTYDYPHGVMDEKLPCGRELPKKWALQHPGDYIEALKNTVAETLRKADVAPEEVAAMGIDFTTCTLLPLYEDGTPLCFDEKFRREPNAYVKLWKHHGAWQEAEEITAILTEKDPQRLAVYGGKVSSEWMIPKIAETVKNAPRVYENAHRFTEAGDWIAFLLTGEEKRAISYAGFKGFWTKENGYPSKEVFRAIDPRMENIIGTKIPEEVNEADEISGYINENGAKLTGLPVGIPVAQPMIDAQAALPALKITGSGQMMHILGTSACLITNSDGAKPVAGVCGYVEGGVSPQLTTYEAGQTAVGDIFDWFVKNCVPEKYVAEAKKEGVSIHGYLREKAKKLRPGQSGLIALDWFNGNRSVLNDAALSGMILGLTINTKPEEIYRTLIEATAFGAKKIIEAFETQGIPVSEVLAAGGIALKDEMMMQIYADVLQKPIKIAETAQAGALGSAIKASVAAGIYPNMGIAAEKMGKNPVKTYVPIEENAKIYEKLYGEYNILHDYFGRGANEVMKRLMSMK